ncbi:DUF1553 domain-containing protein [Phragmitibacter flavus]|uniref:DUF1553 domain-containing protein n=1 Tax=Phragmitibacter flavus TaxID=2576071 RepID=A0A5R8KF43_9BACT|nr:DUF1553 domain-containing protein [Phragmitibacter flavus]TLD70877.1 DUF1553 domain-containing protein [Phragmitibacter flavus]
MKAVLIIFVGLLTLSSLRLAAEITAQQREFFEAKIRPVLIAECYECHSGKESKGGLLLDSRGALREGGDSGNLLLPGDGDGSLLIETLRHAHADQDLHMPKNGAKLEESIIADFVAWINMGAPDPRDTAEVVATGEGTWEQTYALRSKWWSFQPLKKIEPAKGGGHPIDGFIDEKLRLNGLSRAEKADKRTLLRRLSFAVTGLPPKVNEIEEFLKDESPQAWARAVDRYLASTAYGETWARHWMDLMRYAESHGSEGDPSIPFAWRYRDHLIRAFNDDVPYDQMVREHVAGDLLESARWNKELRINESLLATANLRLMEHGFQPVDSLDEQVKTVDNQVEVLTKSFLGLTVSCARCHDHKFDAISQKDYFALYGIFASTRPGQVTLDDPELLAMHREELGALKAKIKAGLVKEWMTQSDQIPQRLDAGDDELEEVQERLAAMESKVRAGLGLNGKQSTLDGLPRYMARWDFEVDGRDSMGILPVKLEGGAVVRDGRLVLDGKEAFGSATLLADGFKEKSLEAWVMLADVAQRGGGVVSVETANGSVFDGLVFGEMVPGEWIAGSNNHLRTQCLEGPVEEADKLVHLVVVYGADKQVTMYRNGVVYGGSYSVDDIPEFNAGDTRVLLGRRHTGGGRAFLKGEIEEAAIYDESLDAKQVSALFRQGINKMDEAQLLAGMTDLERVERGRLLERRKVLLESQMAKQRTRRMGESKWGTFYPWTVLKDVGRKDLPGKWGELVDEWRGELESRNRFNDEHFVRLWDLQGADYSKWNLMGNGLPIKAAKAGEFVIQSSGDLVVNAILPAGIYSHGLSTRHNGLLVSPYFNVDASALSVRMAGGGGGGVRVMMDNYPLGVNETYPQSRPDEGPMKWVRLDTDYRKGSRAYLEMATYDDLTRPKLNDGATEQEKPDGRSWFGISEVWLNKDAEKTPREEVMPVSLLMRGSAPTDVQGLIHKVVELTKGCLVAWEKDSMSEEQRAWLDDLISHGVLSATMKSLPEELSALVADYRGLESKIPLATRAPGPVEGDGYDSRLMIRGSHTELGDVVPRRFLQVLGGGREFTSGSGRRELAEAMTDSEANPLLARVMVNRVWHWLFGRGLVTTVDNFGRLGERPTHPELLDWLAGKFIEDGYSVKKLIRMMLTSQTWQQGHWMSNRAREMDEGNQWWSRMPVRRLEAEMIRDAMLEVSGMRDDSMYGEPVPDTKFRRSIYLPERRNRPHPFLEVFDRPKPATTRGQRDATNIPAQSLTMMNDVYVRNLAKRWAKRVMAEPHSEDAVSERLHGVYESAFGRVPTDEEIEIAAGYLGEKPTEDSWSDYLQALFAIKEFIYLR